MYPPDFYRDHHEPSEMSTDDIVSCYGLAVRLRKYEHGPSLDTALRVYLFTARQELAARGREHLERIREYLPVYYDPARRRATYGPGVELFDPPQEDERNGEPSGYPRGRELMQHAGAGREITK